MKLLFILYCYYFFSEPYVYSDSRFGNGQYPIVYSSVSCGGWEDSLIQCTHNQYKDTVCSRQHVAGVLCGYGILIIIIIIHT